MAHDANCIFCKIIEGSIPSQKVYETDRVLAFRDIAPAAPVHILIIPKKHIPTLNDLSEQDAGFVSDIAVAAQKIAAEQGIAAKGYRLINNCGPDGGQVVYHLHVHLLAGEKLGPLNGNS